jgi:hypothetical protein
LLGGLAKAVFEFDNHSLDSLCRTWKH